MTRVTTITEFSEGERKIVSANCSDGFSARLVYQNEEAVITSWDSDGEEDQQRVHPHDAIYELLGKFF